MSGLIGSVVGAAATFLATSRAIKASVTANERLAKDQQKAERDAIWRGLLIETKENLKMVTSPKSPARFRVRLVTSVWQRARSEVQFLPYDLQENLIHLYTLISQHNDVILHERHVARGESNSTLEKLQTEINTELEKVMPSLIQQVQSEPLT